MTGNGNDVAIACPSCKAVSHHSAGFAARVRVIPCFSCGEDIDRRHAKDSAEWDAVVDRALPVIIIIAAAFFFGLAAGFLLGYGWA